MPTLLLERQNLADIQSTFSSWDSCMSKAYCKWPVVAAIIVGALIVISLLTCLFRCLCCGAECCCACFSCCNACCPSPRRRNKNYGGGGGYQAPPPPPPTYPTYNQYAPPAQQHGMPYASGGLGYPPSAHTATFDVPTRKGLRGGSKAVEDPHADTLPAMPSWDTARDKRVSLTAEEREAEEQEAMEMQRLQSPTERTAAQGGPQSQALLAAHAQDKHDDDYAPHGNPYGYNNSAVSSQQRPGPPLAVATGPYSNQPTHRDPYFSHPNSAAPISPSSQYTEHQPYAPTSAGGHDQLSALHAAPYHDYTRHEQFVPSLYGSQRTTTTTAGAGLDRYDSFSQHQQSAPPPRYYAAAVPGGSDGNNPISPQNTGYAPSIPPSYHSQAVSPIATSAPQLPMGIPAALQPASPVGGQSATAAAAASQQQASSGLPAALQPGAQTAAAQKMPARRPVQGSWREV